MLNVGVGEMAVILLVALIVFGPARLPEIARSVGKFVRNFQHETSRALNDLREGIDVKADMEPIKLGIFDEPDPSASNGGMPDRSPSLDANGRDANRWLDVPGFKPSPLKDRRRMPLGPGRSVGRSVFPGGRTAPSPGPAGEAAEPSVKKSEPGS